MKKICLAIIPWLFSFFTYKAMAQEDLKKPDEKKETEEIIIRKKGDKDANITIQITGDKVLVNGKPLVEFKDDEITVNKRKIIVKNGEHFMLGPDLAMLGDGMENFSWNFEDSENPRPFLGVVTDDDKKGAKILEVTKESAAELAGLKKDDIITKVDETKIDGPESLSESIGNKKPKDEVKIYYLRDGKEKSVKATLQQKKFDKRVFSYTSPDGLSRALTIPQARGYNDQWRSFDDARKTVPRSFNYDYLNGDEFPRQKKLGLKIQDTEEGNGVKVLDVEENSAAATAGLKKDDIITEVGSVKVSNTDEVREQLMENKEKASYNIKAKRNGSAMSFDIKIPKKLKTANL